MGKTRILIVEDETVTAAGLEKELIAQGFEVTGIADTAKEAIRLCREDRPDLVLIDIQIRGLADGIFAAEVITCVGIPVIFLTAHYDENLREKTKAASPVGFVSKPIDPVQLSLEIGLGLERHRSRQQVSELFQELESERAHLKELHQLLPLCSVCKKPRFDADYLASVEAYANANPSGTLWRCPDCIDKTGFPPDSPAE